MDESQKDNDGRESPNSQESAPERRDDSLVAWRNPFALQDEADLVRHFEMVSLSE